VDVQLYQVAVTVTDREGRYVPDLRPEDFLVELDGVQQEVRHLTQDMDTPLSLGLLMDTSASMRLRIPAAVAAGRTLVEEMHPDDELYIMTFNEFTSLRQNFTNNPAKLNDALAKIKPASRWTRLFSAVLDGIERARKGHHKKRALIVISDGWDSSGEMSIREFRRRLRASEMLIYGVEIREAATGSANHVPNRPISRTVDGNDVENRVPGGSLGSAGRSVIRPPTFPGGAAPYVSAREVFAAIESETGGRSFHTLSDQGQPKLALDLEKIVQQISAELRGQYSLGFYPSAPFSVSSRLRIMMTNPEYHVHSRK
jgi:VWFA-related protein